MSWLQGVQTREELLGRFDEGHVQGKPVCMSALDHQEGGNHYARHAIQPFDYIHANRLGFAEGNVVKYITRHRDKNGAQDIRKAIHYCQMLLEKEYGEAP